MNALWQGIQLGLVLSMLLGPIFFALVQAGVEHGFRAGLMVGLGIWVSDVLFILFTYSSILLLDSWVQHPHFTTVVGTAGSVVLVVFGVGALVAPKPTGFAASIGNFRRARLGSLWLKGFLINTINPFTVFFWVGLSSTVVLKGELMGSDAGLLFVGILSTIVLTDTLKVLLAKSIRHHLRPRHLLWFRRLSGVMLILFGVVLVVRAWMN